MKLALQPVSPGTSKAGKGSALDFVFVHGADHHIDLVAGLAIRVPLAHLLGTQHYSPTTGTHPLGVSIWNIE